MSVDARRRKPRVSGDSEEFSEDSYDDNEANKGSEGDTDRNASSEGLRESEYETLDEAGETESEGNTAVDDDDDDGELSDNVIIEYERQEGDGQESVPPKEKKLDDDEDRRNPQYIPKRGTFYEHDDRTAIEDVNEETVEKDVERNKENEKKKVWKEHENRWSHDRYNEEDQAPKSRDELIAIYGYDIRNEDAPPRARRRRKYGRGPNKYTRNWEDEDAYGKSGSPVLRGNGSGGRGGLQKTFSNQIGESEEEFPPLDNIGQSGIGHKIGGVQSRSGTISVSHMRGTNQGSHRGRHGSGSSASTAFPPSPRSPGHDSEIITETSRDDKTNSNSSGCSNVTNVGKKNNSQKNGDDSKNRDGSHISIKDIIKNASTNVCSNINANPLSKTLSLTDDKKDKIEGNGWKTRRDRSGPRPLPEDSVAKDTNSDWRNKNKGDRHGMQGIPVESQTFTPTIPRGRGRVQRGTGPGRHAVEIKSTSTLTESSRRSLSETRMLSHEKGDDSNPYIKSQVVNRTTDDVSKELSQININEYQTHLSNRDYSKKSMKNNLPHFHQVPPRMQENAANKPKRYSSQRQRSLPDNGAVAAVAAAAAAAAASYTPPHGYFSSGYAQQPEELEGMGVVSSGYVQPPPVYGEAQQQAPPPAVVTQPAATTPPMGLLAPPHPQAQTYAAPPFSSPPFIPPPVAGPPPQILPPGAATYMTTAPSGAPIINYVTTPPQNQFARQAYASFQGYTAVPAAQPPPELYQPQGITYYSPEEQVMPRTITQKRQSTAIPIVPPPDRGPRGRGRLREECNGVLTAPGGEQGAGDASNLNVKGDQMEDAVDSKKDLTGQEAEETVTLVIDPISDTSEGTEHGISKNNLVSLDIIDSINVTEIPESVDAMEAAKSIREAAEAASAIINSVSNTVSNISTATANTTNSTGSSTVNEAAMKISTSTASEQEIQA